MRIRNNYVNKIIIIAIYWLISCYSLSSCAAIEKRLCTDRKTGEKYIFISPPEKTAIITQELATEIADALTNHNYSFPVRLHLGITTFIPGALNAIMAALQTNRAIVEELFVLRGVGNEELRTLAEILKTHTTLSDLTLVGNRIGPEGAQILAAALVVNNALLRLNLENTYLEAEGMREIATALNEHPTLRVLHASRNHFGMSGAMAIAAMLHTNKRLTDLFLLDNEIGGEGAATIAAALEANNTLVRLWLSINNIGDRGSIALAKALLVNNTLTDLDLGLNNIGDEGAQALAEMLQINTNLTNLLIANNNLGPTAAQAIAAALRVNRSLAHLDLAHNNIGIAGTNALLEAMVYNTALQQIQADWAPAQELTVLAILDRNKAIQEIAESVRALKRRIDTTVLAATHPCLGANSPFNLLEPYLFRQIVDYYREDELNFILNLTPTQLEHFTPREQRLITRIRGTHQLILEYTQNLTQPEGEAVTARPLPSTFEQQPNTTLPILPAEEQLPPTLDNIGSNRPNIFFSS